MYTAADVDFGFVLIIMLIFVGTYGNCDNSGSGSGEDRNNTVVNTTCIMMPTSPISSVSVTPSSTTDTPVSVTVTSSSTTYTPASVASSSIPDTPASVTPSPSPSLVIIIGSAAGAGFLIVFLLPLLFCICYICCMRVRRKRTPYKLKEGDIGVVC